MDLNFVINLIAPIAGLVAILIGVGAICIPQKMSKQFGIPVSGASLAFVVGVGIRDVFMGLAMLTLYILESWTALAVIMIGVGIVAVSDFVVVYKSGNKKASAVHIASAVIALAYGVWLLV